MPTPKGAFGTNVSAWIGKMMGPAASGGWSVSRQLAVGGNCCVLQPSLLARLHRLVAPQLYTATCRATASIKARRADVASSVSAPS